MSSTFVLEPPARTSSETAVFTNARLVLEDEVITGSLAISGGRITAIDQSQSRAAGAIDCAGDYLAPGLIELHTDNLERHIMPRPGVPWPRRAAVLAHDAELASTGITTVFDALRAGSIISSAKSRYGKYAREISRDILEMRAEGRLKISHFIHLRAEICSETLIEELDEFGPEDRIGIVSLMDHTPGQRQFTDTTQLRTYLSGKYSMSDGDIDAHIDFQKGVKARFGEAHASAAVTRAHDFGAVIASHDDTTAEHVVQSRNSGVTLAEFPTTMEAAEASHDCGIRVMMGAPNLIRGGSHSGNVAAADLADRGLLDILSSDYVPASLLLAAVMLGTMSGDLPGAIARVTANPARAAELNDRGRLAPGLRGDLVRFSADGETPVIRGAWVRGERVA